MLLIAKNGQQIVFYKLTVRGKKTTGKTENTSTQFVDTTEAATQNMHCEQTGPPPGGDAGATKRGSELVVCFFM